MAKSSASRDTDATYEQYEKKSGKKMTPAQKKAWKGKPKKSWPNPFERAAKGDKY